MKPLVLEHDTTMVQVVHAELKKAPEAIGAKEVFSGETRPTDGQRVLYYFEPFEQWYVGVYQADSDFVHGVAGFSTWLPEVTKWMDGVN